MAFFDPRQTALRTTVRRAGLAERATSHRFRPSFASHLPGAGYDIRTMRVLNKRGRGVRGPPDRS